MLLQKWFRINSDPELENQINDRLSFKRFLGLVFDKPSPDYFTFSQLRLSKNALDVINSDILSPFKANGLTINKGIAVDARLVKSTSQLVSNDKLKQLRDKNDTPEGKLNKNGNIKKYTRDLDDADNK